MAVRIQARLLDRAGFPLAGLVQILPIRASAANTMQRTLDTTGMFTADTSSATAFRVISPSGRVITVDVSTPGAPTVSADASRDEQLRLIYAGDAAMQDQTPQTMAAAQAEATAKADAAAAQAGTEASSALAAAAAAKSAAQAAQATADAAQGSAAAFSATLAQFTAAMQTSLSALATQLAAANARKVGLVIARVPIPGLALGVEKPVTAPWTPAPPVAPTATGLLYEPTGSLLGQVSASIRADSVTATGVTVLLKAPLNVALGAGSVVVGAYLN